MQRGKFLSRLYGGEHILFDVLEGTQFLSRLYGGEQQLYNKKLS